MISETTKRKILNNEEGIWKVGEIMVLKWQYGQLGSFSSTLFSLIGHADHNNREKLAMGFPDEVEGFMAWSRGDLASRFEAYDKELENK